MCQEHLADFILRIQELEGGGVIEVVDESVDVDVCGVCCLRVRDVKEQKMETYQKGASPKAPDKLLSTHHAA